MNVSVEPKICYPADRVSRVFQNMASHLTKSAVVPEVMGLNVKACRGFCVIVVFLYLNLEVEFVYSTTVNPYQPNSELLWTVCLIIPGPKSSSN